jgi:hypothetical protein
MHRFEIKTNFFFFFFFFCNFHDLTQQGVTGSDNFKRVRLCALGRFIGFFNLPPFFAFSFYGRICKLFSFTESDYPVNVTISNNWIRYAGFQNGFGAVAVFPGTGKGGVSLYSESFNQNEYIPKAGTGRKSGRRGAGREIEMGKGRVRCIFIYFLCTRGAQGIEEINNVIIDSYRENAMKGGEREREIRGEEGG